MKNKVSPFNWRAELENFDVDSIDNDIIISNNMLLPTGISYPIKFDVTVSLICIKGKMNVSVNLKEFKIQSPGLFVVISNQNVQFESISEDFSGLIMLMSDKFLENMLSGPQERIPLFLSVYENPWATLNIDELNVLTNYYSMVQKEMRKKENPYRLETVKHLIQAQFYGTGYKFYKVLENDKKSKHELLLEEFLRLVSRNYKEQREVGFYAEKLKLTPKYLSKIIHDNSTKSANDWINEHVVLEAKALLKSTNMNIQQISDHLNFASQTFFGKYFKRLTGVSPKEYMNS
ncbi:MAG: helix-turn-helix domain-containing protein [Bacteroidales bacterium]